MAKIVSTGKTLATTDFHKKRQALRRRQVIIVSAISILVLVGLGFFFHIKSLQIKNVEITGTDAVVSSRAEAFVRDMLAERYLWILPKSNALIYPNGTLEKGLLESFPRFRSVSVSLANLQTLHISIVDKKPYGLYCEEEACYFLDENGLIFDQAPVFSEGVYFVYRKWHDQTSPLGKYFLPSEEFRALAPMIEGFSTLSGEEVVEPRELNFINNEFTLSLDSGATIFWPRGRNTSEVFEDLEAFLSSNAIKNERDFWSRIKTLNLNTSGKVVYTFR